MQLGCLKSTVVGSALEALAFVQQRSAISVLTTYGGVLLSRVTSMHRCY
jgi:hypothetical protein